MPHMLYHTLPLSELLKKINTFTWDEAVDQAFQWLKALMAITFHKTLQYYDHSSNIFIKADASRRSFELASYKKDNSLPWCVSPSWIQRLGNHRNRVTGSSVYFFQRFQTYLWCQVIYSQKWPQFPKWSQWKPHLNTTMVTMNVALLASVWPCQ